MNSFALGEVARGYFETQDGVRNLCAGFLEESGFSTGFSDNKDVLEVANHWARSAYESAIAIAFEHSASEIERQFMLSLVLSFVMADPLGYDFTPPLPNAPDGIAKLREDIAAMRTLQKEFGNKGAADRIAVVDKGLEAMFIRYTTLRGSGHVHLTPQAGFPKTSDGQRAVRLDLLAWVPDKAPMLAFECDGYEWHSSKDSFTSDRARDRMLKKRGVDVLRFSGSEIYRNMANCSIQALDHIRRVFGARS